MIFDIRYIDIIMKKKSQGLFRDLREFKHLAGQFKTLSDEHRLLIIAMLANGEKCVCEIYEFLRLPQNLVSYHLKILKDSGLVESRREGKRIYYRISKKGNILWYEKILRDAMRIIRKRAGI